MVVYFNSNFNNAQKVSFRNNTLTNENSAMNKNDNSESASGGGALI